MKSKSFLNFSGNLVANTFCRVLASKRTDLGGCFTQKVSDIGQAKFFFGQNSSEIL